MSSRLTQPSIALPSRVRHVFMPVISIGLPVARHAEVVAGVRAAGRPAHDDLVVVAIIVVDLEIQVRERVPSATSRWSLTPCGADDGSRIGIRRIVVRGSPSRRSRRRDRGFPRSRLVEVLLEESSVLLLPTCILLRGLGAFRS